MVQMIHWCWIEFPWSLISTGPPAGVEVLAGVLDGDPLLSVRGDSAEDARRIVDPVLQAWREGKVPMDEYAAGSDGPASWE